MFCNKDSPAKTVQKSVECEIFAHLPETQIELNQAIDNLYVSAKVYKNMKTDTNYVEAA